MSNARILERWTGWRWAALGLGEAALLAAVGLTFWLQEWRYAQATPRPEKLVQPPLGARLSLGEVVAGADAPLQTASAQRAAPGPTVLHFFNPDCPCSRFNAAHLRQLREEFAGRAEFVAVLEGEGEAAELQAAFAAWDLDLRSVVDVDGALAAAAGVYATPQAVVLAADGTLHYRGNYNVQRFCSDRRTQFVRRALETLLAPVPDVAADPFPPEGDPKADVPFDPLDPRACTAFGCPLPLRSGRSEPASPSPGTQSSAVQVVPPRPPTAFPGGVGERFGLSRAAAGSASPAAPIAVPVEEEPRDAR